MPRYEARVDLVGSSADAEKALSALADAATETADKLEESFERTSDTISGQLSGLGKDGAEQFGAVGDSAEENAGRVTDAFTQTSGTVNGLLDDMAGKADEKSGLITKSFDKSFASVGDTAEVMSGRITEALDSAVTATDERSTTISGSLERAFAAGGDSSTVMVGKLGETLDAMLAETTQKSALLTARLDEAFAKGGLAAQKLKGATTSALTNVGGRASTQAGLAAQLEQIEALNKANRLTNEEAEAARAKVLGSISGGSIESQLGLLGGLQGQKLISNAEYEDAKAKLVGLRREGEGAASGIKEKFGSIFTGLGSSLGNFGLPGTEQFNKIGERIKEAKTPGGTLVQSAAGVGQLATEAGLAGVIGFGAESIHLSDQLETAQNQLATAVKNAGTAWKAYEPELQKAIASTQKLGFTNTETEQALQILTTATNKPSVAIKDLGLVEDIARMKGISLGEAAQGLAKVYSGNTRLLAQWGLNLDIGSGKLHNIQQATETVTKAQLSLKEAQQAATQTGVTNSQKYAQAMISEQQAATSLAEAHLSGSDAVANALAAEQAGTAEVDSAQVKGAAAVALLRKNQMDLTEAIEQGSLRNTAAALAYEKAQQTVGNTTEQSSYSQVMALERVTKAQMDLHNAQLNLKEDQQAIPDVLNALQQRTKGTAQSYITTLPGQIKVLDAELHNLGTSFGEFLVPKLEKAGAELEKVFTWFQKNKGAAEALGIAVGTVLGGAVLVFVEQKLAKLVHGLGKAYDDLKSLTSAAGRLFGIGGKGTTGGTTGGASTTASDEKIGSAATTMQSAADTMQEAANTMKGAGAAQETAGAEEQRAGAEEITAGAEEDAGGGLGGSGTAGVLSIAKKVLAGLPAGAGIAAGAATAAYLGYKEFGALKGGLAELSPTEHGYTGYGNDIGSQQKLATNAEALETYLGALTDVIKGKALSSSLVNQIGAEGPGGGADVNQLATWLHRTAGNQATGEDIISSLLGLEKHTQLTSTEKGQINSLISDVHKTLLTGGKTSGAALTQGLGEGITGGAGIANNAATRSAQGVVTKTKDVYKQHSPSLVFHQIGADLMTSEATGITQNMHLVFDALSRLETQVQKDMAKIGALTGSVPGNHTGPGRAGTTGQAGFPNMNTTWEVNIDKLVAQNPNEMARQLKMKERRSNLVRT